MCPFYYEGATDYDAKSELYSFGIVLLEVLTGRLQGSFSGADKKKKLMLHRSVSTLTADSRAGAWNEECVSRLLELAKQCIADYDDRIDSMKTVMHMLRQIKDDCCPQPTATESVLQQRMAALLSQNEAVVLARDVAAATAAKAIRKCLVCFDDELLISDGFECSSKKHFVCQKNGCFAQITKDQSASRADFVDRGCKILCTVPDCGEVIEDHLVAMYAGKGGFDAYLSAKQAANEEKLVVEYEAKLRTLRTEVEREVANSLQAARLRHRNYIIEELLAIKCPNPLCKMVFIMDNDFDDCFALQCARCRSHYCGWCLKNFGKADAHAHTLSLIHISEPTRPY